MKQVSMKNVGARNVSAEVAGMKDAEPDYPWGLRLHLEEDQLAALGVKNLPASGAPVGIEATGLVVGMSEETVDGKTRRRLELQITDLALAAAGTSRYAAMYADDPTMKKES